MSVEKNKEYVVDIIDNGYQGEGIAKVNNFTIFIPGAIKGEKVRILIVKVLTSHAFGKIVDIIKKSENRVDVDCKTYKRCGGCCLRHIKYEETLKVKQNSVQSLVNKTLNKKIDVRETLGMDYPYYYRNKIQFPVGIDKDGKPQMGVFANRTHEIIPIEECLIQNETSEKIAKYIFNFWINKGWTIYNEKTREGLLRHIVIKVGIKTNEFMCILVINGKDIANKESLVSSITREFPQVKSIVLNSNMKNTNVILGDVNTNIFGEGYITDKLGDFIFKISPMSFYQVNPVQTLNLYNLAVQGANISKGDIVFDLYCGIGTISIFMSKFAKKVYGIEIVKEAVESAKENAKINNIKNVEFLAGDVEKVLEDMIVNKNIIPDIIMVDPPRRGLDDVSISNILKVKPKRLVYISCNPATLVRDLAKLEDTYDIMNIRPVDMFPYTGHVECVSLLYLK